MKADEPSRGWSRNPLGEIRQAGFVALGCLMLLLGLVGAFLPVMPTTIFLILAAWCFGRSSPRWEAWMLDHPRFGPVIRDWRDHGAMPRRAKWMAFGGITAGYALLWFAAKPAPWLAVTVAAAMLACAAWIAMRPERSAAEPGGPGEGGRPCRDRPDAPGSPSRISPPIAPPAFSRIGGHSSHEELPAGSTDDAASHAA